MLAALVLLALLVAAALFFGGTDSKRTITIDFTSTNSVYKGSDVKILGVPVGRVTKLTPRGDVVRATVSYDGKYKLPSDVKAVVMSPSIVGDRFIQLAPAYTGGAALKDGAYIPVGRTAVPVELDAVYQSLDDLSTALGPKGANKNGALSDLIDNTANQFDGQGAQLNETIQNFSKLSSTLSNNKEELFGSLREVNDFVTLLKSNDETVRAFNDSTARVSKVLAGERDDLAGTLKALSLALVDVNGLVTDNRTELRANIKNLTSLSSVLAKHEDDIKQIVVNAPTALTNVALAYNSTYGTLDTRSSLSEILTGSLGDPSSLICNLLGESSTSGVVCPTLSMLLGNLPTPPALPSLPNVPTPTLPSLPTPRSAAASSPYENVNSSWQDMLAVS